MKYILLFIALIPFFGFTQNVIPFIDFSNYFRSFQNRNFRILQMQPVSEFKTGDDMVAYMDNRGNLMVYDGTRTTDIANSSVEYTLSDHLLVWKIGYTLNIWDNNKLKTLTYNGGQYAVKDSMVIFEDNRYNAVKIYENGEIKTVYQAIGNLQMPIAVGDNIMAYKDNGDFYRIYYKGETFDIDVWQGNINFSCGTDVLAFNDPTTRTFAAFENGGLIDVEDIFVNKYKAGRGFIVYEDNIGNLIRFQNGVKTKLTDFGASFWEVKDDIVIWGENSFLYMANKEKKWKVCNYIPETYKVKNKTLAFQNAMNGVSVSQDGKMEVITTLMDSQYEIFGNSVLVTLFNRSFLVYSNGEIFEQ